MNVPDNKHKAPKDTLLNKILNEISSQKSEDSLENGAMPSPAEIETKNTQTITEDNQECEKSSIELTDADVSTKKYCKKDIINEEEEETPKKLSWLKMFFLFLSIVFILNIVYIMYFMNSKENYMADKEKNLITEKQEIVEQEALKEVVEKNVIERDVVKKEIPKPIIKTPITIEKPLVKEETMHRENVPVVKPHENRQIQKETEIPKTAEELHQDKVNKNPQNFIDVIEMTTVTPVKALPKERSKPLTKEEKKLIERDKAKAILLEQMNQ